MMKFTTPATASAPYTANSVRVVVVIGGDTVTGTCPWADCAARLASAPALNACITASDSFFLFTFIMDPQWKLRNYNSLGLARQILKPHPTEIPTPHGLFRCMGNTGNRHSLGISTVRLSGSISTLQQCRNGQQRNVVVVTLIAAELLQICQ